MSFLLDRVRSNAKKRILFFGRLSIFLVVKLEPEERKLAGVEAGLGGNGSYMYDKKDYRQKASKNLLV